MQLKYYGFFGCKQIMDNEALQIELLERQIDLQETNYKEAIFLQKDYTCLRKMRDDIKDLKQQLLTLKEEKVQPKTTDDSI